MKKNCIAVFAKTPGLSALKTRLAKDIGKEKAEEIFVLCVDEVQKTLLEFTTLNPDWNIIWALAEETAPTHKFWQNRPFKKIWTGDGGLGTRQANIYEKLHENYETIILIGTDCPHVSIENLQLAATPKDKTIFGPATDGGYYLLSSLQNISRDIWESVPYSCAETLQVFEKKLGNVEKLKPLTDLDEITDIPKILEEVGSTNVADIYLSLSQLSTSAK